MIMKNNSIIIGFLLVIIITACAISSSREVKASKLAGIEKDLLPVPYSTRSGKNFSKVIGWPAGKIFLVAIC
jgi:hypothetical protein